MSFAELRTRQQAAGATFTIAEGHEFVLHYSTIITEYETVRNGAALFDASAVGRFWIHDRDRATLLHRLSTNNIEVLQTGQGCQTVLTNHNGRIIDLLTVHRIDEQLLITTSPQQRDAVFNLVRKNIFFNDKVKLKPASDKLGQFHLYGPQSAALLHTVSGASVDDLPLHHICAAEINGMSLWIARIKPLNSDVASAPGAAQSGAGAAISFALYVPVETLAEVWDALCAAGAQPLGAAAYDILRVEAGQGVFGRELSLEYIPLETGLWDAISFTKGCYVGQEIIARMESRNRLAKQLRGLKLRLEHNTADESSITELQLPVKLDVGGKEAGDLTSIVQSPHFGPIALAYVRTAHAAPGAVVGVASSNMTGEVVELPFA
ncbi:MAG: glycine cleavage system protein T [Chloroflexales bacterium]|nr:glycine cleavage system protein T [Chloroflexales bacterium]